MAQNLPKVIKYCDFDVGKVRISAKPKETPNGSKLAYVNYGPKTDRVLIQTPLMKLPFGISRSDPMNKYSSPTDPKKYFVEPVFDRTDKKQNEFLQSMQDFDRKVINTLLTNGMAYLSDPQPTIKEVLSKMASGGFSVRYPMKDYNVALLEYPPTDDLLKDTYNDPKVRFKIMKNYGGKDDGNTSEYDVEIYDSNGQEISMKDVRDRCEVRCLVECMGIRIVNKMAYVSWKLRQMIVYGGATAPLPSNSFVPSDDEENTAPVPTTEYAAPENVDTEQNVDDDDENEADEADEEELQKTIESLQDNTLENEDDEETPPEKPKRKARGRKKADA